MLIEEHLSRNCEGMLRPGILIRGEAEHHRKELGNAELEIERTDIRCCREL